MGTRLAILERTKLGVTVEEDDTRVVEEDDDAEEAIP